MINQSIFKAYDVRGIYPVDLNEDAAFGVGRAFITLTGAKNVVVGHDARLSSPALFKALVAGLLSQGAQVTSIGQTPTEGLYFAVGSYDFDAGIMITASHNPKDYNGFKMMTKSGKDIVWIRGKELLSSVNLADTYKENDDKIDTLDIWADYMKLMESFFDAKHIKPFKVVIDASSGVMGAVMEMIKEKLPVQIISLNFTPDGNFPNHSPNPLEEGASAQIAQKIQEEKADFGFMFDGDADRIFLVDETGKVSRGDTTLLILAKHFLSKFPGMAVAYNAVCSRTLPEFVKKWGGVPIRTQVGFVNVREGLINNNGVVGGETSCHYCFKDYFYMDSGMIAFLTLLQLISADGRKVSEIIKGLSPYVSAEMNFKAQEKDAILENVKQKYSDGQQDFLDGVTVQYDRWWFNLRPSNTEPVIKLTIEADTQELLDEKKKELSDVIGE